MNAREEGFIWEDHLTERKSENDLKDLLKTLVAFANTVSPGHVAQILIGELDDGTAQGIKNIDQIQKEIRKACKKPYPPILWRVQPYEKSGKTCLRIEIEYSGDTPHFGDAAWIRQGSESVEASDTIFQRLISLRTSKNRELQQWLGKPVTVTWIEHRGFIVSPKLTATFVDARLIRLTEFHATFESRDGTQRKSEPLKALTLSWDDHHERIQIFVSPI